MSDNESTSPSSTGAKLKKAREELGLSLRDVSEELKLSVTQLGALESDDYSQLPGMTYVRGYIRSYSRMLNLPDEELEQSLRLTITTPPEGDSIALQRIGETKKSGSVIRSFIILCILLAGAGAGYVWWKDNMAGSPGSVAPVGAINSVGPATDQGPAGESAVDIIGETGSSNVTAPASEPSSAPLADNTGGPTTSSGDPTVIVLRFQQPSFIDIRDAQKNRMVNRNVLQGEELVLSGQPPFNLYLGNANAVEVEYRGEVVDFSAYVTGVFARFSLGE